MHVQIRTEKKKAGLLGGKVEWQTTMKIKPTEEEKAIVSENVIGGFEILSLPMFTGHENTDHTIDDLLSREILTVSQTKWHANEAAQKLKAAAVAVKSAIEETLEDHTGEFEL